MLTTRYINLGKVLVYLPTLPLRGDNCAELVGLWYGYVHNRRGTGLVMGRFLTVVESLTSEICIIQDCHISLVQTFRLGWYTPRFGCNLRQFSAQTASFRMAVLVGERRSARDTGLGSIQAILFPTHLLN